MKFTIALAGLLAGGAYATPIVQREPQSQSWSNVASSTVQAAPASNPTQLAGNPNAAPNPPANAELVKNLLTASSSVDKFTQLQQGITDKKASLKFDFNPAANPQITPGAGGEVVVANRANYPLLTNLGVGAAALFFAPCGLNTPHTHPRATEILTVATNSNIMAGFVLENGFVAEQNTTLTQWQAMAFPMGSIHWQQNLDCTPAVAVAGFNSEDPGASSIAQNYLVNTNGDVVDASLGFPEQITPDNFAQFKAKIPKPFAAGVEACYKKCGFKH